MLPPETTDIVPMAMDLDIRYEDDEIVVVNKPAGLLTHPTARERIGSIQSGLYAYLSPQGQVPHCVHRLDRDTSGLVLFAKHAHVHHLFDEALRKGQVHRVYAAIVHVAENVPGTPADDDTPGLTTGAWHTIDMPIALHPDKPSRRIIAPEGQRAVTHYRFAAVHPPAALVQLVLETGRTHQIRLHMAAAGMPLVGDRDYGNPALPAMGLRRQALHAVQLGWRHPVTGVTRTVSAAPPADLRAAWRRAGGRDEDWAFLLEDEEALHHVRIV
ncbi:RluA family pseudouridine synthase [Alicyclobacillus cycloheptanicus]|uniref:RNA pseudouridylate synthase n=1 Tax=Alicyclobacillus cycloheptanicus TaxID=1457 RepID=A0ABT9XEC8_9BACL|nr:RluA family pseudouridine synthase [Alicyclobacillus cycloheptanicus]MDQ0188537.1 23S rRNA pseudouridine1911/1915/1917 synthase [Alicyclobacillus cycloheptanicus]WDM01222.1 RluA family pseudouridine synthase [Alicyclobacillus cycloheptanicus]